MTIDQVAELAELTEEYVKNANVDELTGRMFRLNVDLQKADSNNAAAIALELALIVAFIMEREDEK